MFTPQEGNWLKVGQCLSLSGDCHKALWTRLLTDSRNSSLPLGVLCNPSQGGKSEVPPRGTNRALSRPAPNWPPPSFSSHPTESTAEWKVSQGLRAQLHPRRSGCDTDLGALRAAIPTAGT